jgi:hypothetical protein
MQPWWRRFINISRQNDVHVIAVTIFTLLPSNSKTTWYEIQKVPYQAGIHPYLTFTSFEILFNDAKQRFAVEFCTSSLTY